jgi:hypothetical protein
MLDDQPALCIRRARAGQGRLAGGGGAGALRGARPQGVLAAADGSEMLVVAVIVNSSRAEPGQWRKAARSAALALPAAELTP